MPYTFLMEEGLIISNWLTEALEATARLKCELGNLLMYIYALEQPRFFAEQKEDAKNQECYVEWNSVHLCFKK
jgi:hypothetical protein